jgi:hypothetical protein
MAFSFNTVGSKAAGDTISVPFPYTSKDDVYVLVDGVEVSSTLYSWSSGSTLLCLSGFPEGTTTRVERRSSAASLPSEQQGTGTFDYDGANRNDKHLMFIAQERVDVEETVLNSASQVAEDLASTSAAAAVATVKADAAAASASTASTKADEAAASASTATTKASEAAASASTASTKAGEASTKADEAAASASTATTKAGEASTSADEAAASAAAAATFDPATVAITGGDVSGATLEGAAIEAHHRHGECRLDLEGGLLRLNRFNGKYLIIDGVPREIPATAPSLAPTGLTAGAAVYIYAYMDGMDMKLEASAVGHVMQASTGVRINSSDSTRTLVGFARPEAGPVWVDNSVNRYVLSYFNRREKNFFVAVSSSTTATDWAVLSSPTYFLSWGSSSVEAVCNATLYVSNAGSVGYFGIAFGGATPSYAVGERIRTQSNYFEPASLCYREYFANDGSSYVRAFGIAPAGYSINALEGAINGVVWG